ncbi:MAG: hypothetical protein QOC82_3328 [Frankiaceae bacterium]|jgi:hypothetical protein|nr:hypothetical protein [Frankiaceae bacterium]
MRTRSNPASVAGVSAGEKEEVVRGTVKKTLLGGVAAAVLVMGLPMTSASADPGDTITGGCHFHTDAQQQATQNQNTGVIEASAVMRTSAGLPDAGAWVHCKIQVNGVDAPDTQLDAPANAAGIVQGQKPISFDDQNGTLPSALCEKDDWGDTDTSGWYCRASIEIQVPPQEVIDLLNNTVDPIVCPVLKTIGQQTGGNIAGVITIGPDGDVSIPDPLNLGINPVYDCPPYVVI